MADVVDVIALASVGALGHGNDRVVVVRAVRGAYLLRARCRHAQQARPRSSTVSITCKQPITFSSAATARGTPTFGGTATAAERKKRNVINRETYDDEVNPILMDRNRLKLTSLR